MVLSIIVIVLVAGIAYFHLVEGFFSATISALAAVLAAVLAVSYTEPLVKLIFRGTAGDSIDAIVLCMLFCAGYSILRVSMDKLIPGNVRIPATVDKVGAAAVGLVAGTFGVGIFVVALQMLPFDPQISFLGYSRFEISPKRDVVVPVSGGRQAIDSFVNEQMVENSFDPEKEKNKLWLPADDWVLDAVYHLSDGGSLAGAQPLASVHPDWLGELYAQRTGIQTGSRHVALVLPTSDPVEIAGVYTANSFPAFDGYGKPSTKKGEAVLSIRPPGYVDPYPDQVKATGNLVPLVVRVKLRSNVTDDTDHLFRFGPGSVRLVARAALPDGSFGPATNYYPVGMLEDGKTVVINHIDDFLFVNVGSGDAGFDAVFMVDKSVLVGSKTGVNAVAPGTFLELKRLSTKDLSGTPVQENIAADPDVKVLRTEVLEKELKPDAP